MGAWRLTGHVWGAWGKRLGSVLPAQCGGCGANLRLWSAADLDWKFAGTRTLCHWRRWHFWDMKNTFKNLKYVWNCVFHMRACCFFSVYIYFYLALHQIFPIKPKLLICCGISACCTSSVANRSTVGSSAGCYQYSKFHCFPFLLSEQECLLVISCN